MPRPDQFADAVLRERLVADYRAGKTVPELMVLYRASHQSIRRVLREEDCLRPNPADPKLPPAVSLAVELEHGPDNLTDLAKRLKVSRTAIYSKLRDGGFDLTQPLQPQIDREIQQLETKLANLKRGVATRESNLRRPRRRGEVPAGYITPKQLAEQRGVTLSAVCQQIRAGTIRAERRSFGWIIPIPEMKK